MSVRKVTWGGTTTWKGEGEAFAKKRDALAKYPDSKPKKIVSGEQQEAWAVDYKDNAGVRHHETFRRKKDADARHEQVRTDIRQGKHTPHNTVTVKEVADLWLEYLPVKKRKRTSIASAAQHVKDYIGPVLGRVKLAHLSKRMVHDFHVQMAGRVRKGRRGEAPGVLSDSTVRKAMGTLKSILKYARTLDLMAHNPAEDIRVESTSGSKKKLAVGVDIPSQQEIAALIAAASGMARPFVLVAIFAGLRASELRGLRWQDVDLVKGRIHIVQRADRWGTFDGPKSTAGTRTIPVPPIVINALKEWKLSHGKFDLVFATATGQPHNHGNLYCRMWQPLLIKAGITRPYKLHSCRHFFCSWLINRPEEGGRGFNLKQAQVLLGHATLAMTSDTYGHLLPSDDDSAELAAAADR